jgi:hypothetical protein
MFQLVTSQQDERYDTWLATQWKEKTRNKCIVGRQKLHRLSIS